MMLSIFAQPYWSQELDFSLEASGRFLGYSFFQQAIESTLGKFLSQFQGERADEAATVLHVRQDRDLAETDNSDHSGGGDGVS